MSAGRTNAVSGGGGGVFKIIAGVFTGMPSEAEAGSYVVYNMPNSIYFDNLYIVGADTGTVTQALTVQTRVFRFVMPSENVNISGMRPS